MKTFPTFYAVYDSHGVCWSDADENKPHQVCIGLFASRELAEELMEESRALYPDEPRDVRAVSNWELLHFVVSRIAYVVFWAGSGKLRVSNDPVASFDELREWHRNITEAAAAL